MHTLKTGMLAYFDSFAGLIPCKVVAVSGVSGMASTRQTIRFRLTAKRGAYKRGETLETSGLHIVPRPSVRGNRLRANYVECD